MRVIITLNLDAEPPISLARLKQYVDPAISEAVHKAYTHTILERNLHIELESIKEIEPDYEVLPGPGRE